MGRGQKGCRGYSLLELVSVLLLLGILAAVAAPSLSGSRAIDEAAFVSDVRAALRFAQRTAIAQRRTVCVAFTTASVALTMAPAAAGACSATLAGPGGEQPAATTGGEGFSSVPADFSFDALGAASVGQTLAFRSASITVDAGTGYVH